MKLLIILLILFSPLLKADTDVILSSVKLDCVNSEICNLRKTRFKNLIGEYRSLLHLKDTLKIISSDGGYQSFYYEIVKQNNGRYKLFIRVRIKPLVEQINIGFIDRNIEVDPSSLLPIKEGDFFEAHKFKENIASLQSKLDALGFPHNSHELEVVENKNKITINLGITLGSPRIFKRIKTNASSIFVKDFLTKKFHHFYNKPFEFTKFKLYLDEAQRELFSYGYYLINLDLKTVVKDDHVQLDIHVSNDSLFAFDFKNLKQETRDVLLAMFKDLFRKYKRPLAEPMIKLALQEHYKTRALLSPEVKIEISTFQNKYKEMVQLYRVSLEENFKTKLVDVAFLGNAYFHQKELLKAFHKEAFELASLDYYDEEYFNFFTGFLKTKYIEKGFVQAKITGPTVTFHDGKNQASVVYSIQEGQRAFVRSLELIGIPPELEDKIPKRLTNQVGQHFNPISLVEDIKNVAIMLQEHGYYFAEVTNANEDNLVTYSKSGADVDILYQITAGPLVRLNRVIYLGNNKTQKRVLAKKITLEKNDLITPSKTREIESKLSSTGLFNTVSVTPVRHTSKSAATDIIVRVSERDYGLVEFAPGYRTDIGIKLSGTVSYLNIGGKNRALTLRSQVNQRINYQTFDTRRAKERTRPLEHNTGVTYNQGDIFDTRIDYAANVAYQWKRFYSFDANIFRISNTFTRDITTRLSTSTRYQYEEISQFDATFERDKGKFQIGAITPSLTYDLRNSQVNATKGAFFNMSCEFANPNFFSQKTDDLTINFYKLVSRNRFYLPYKNGTLAISMVGGVQENLATDLVKNPDGSPVYVKDSLGNPTNQKQTEGYIPSIKVFRLTGMDIVRGFNDQEINLQPDKRDISGVRVQDAAYLANFKVEPRYFINDSLMGGVFFDAGRVFVDSVQLNQLRQSVGVTFKILTPVGTLDLDYGFKLLRKRDADGNLESPGRFHVSIGFF